MYETNIIKDYKIFFSLCSPWKENKKQNLKLAIKITKLLKIKYIINKKWYILNPSYE